MNSPNFKVIKLNIDLSDLDLPSQYGGNVGRLIEDELERQGFTINRQQGVDIPGLGVEVKTRKLGSDSPHTVASMTVADIVNTPYNKSPVKEKFTRQFRVTYDDVNHNIVEARIYDFDDEHTQRLNGASYEDARAKIIAGDRSTYISGDHGHFQKVPGTEDSYTYRINNSAMKKFCNGAKSTFNTLYEWQ
jgi:hypothetical protein